MAEDGLNPLIHVPTRLKIIATLAALPDGDTLSFTRLQDPLGSLITCTAMLPAAAQAARQDHPAPTLAMGTPTDASPCLRQSRRMLNPQCGREFCALGRVNMIGT